MQNQWYSVIVLSRGGKFAICSDPKSTPFVINDRVVLYQICKKKKKKKKNKDDIRHTHTHT
jgi:hypothetical protein